MPLLNWDQGYSVNDALLDSQHEKLFEMLNRAYEYVMTTPEVDCVLPIIDELSEYTGYHFSTEEQYMQAKGFSDLDEHIQKHREFTHTIEALRSRYHDNDLEVARELIIILGEWLLCHVLKEDMKYAKAFGGNGE
jgi:hemerythrin-like metal-binding protein